MNFEKSKDFALLLMRITFGGLMLVRHGWGKFQSLLEGAPYKFPSLFGLPSGLSLGMAVFTEVVCALLLIAGLFTRWASAFMAITMFVAAFYIHFSDPLAKKEMAILYLIAYVVIYLLGPGKLSLDHAIRSKS